MDLSEFLNYTETSLAHKKVLITGASAGFGLATACRLAVENANICLLARRENLLTDIKQALLTKFPNLQITCIASDIREAQTFEILRQAGWLDVDILINNAGLARGLDTVQTALLSDWQEMIDTNLTAAVKIVHAVLPAMINKKSGHIVNVASIAGHEAYDRGSVYCATKHAIIAFSKALRSELCDKNIRVSIVSPGMAHTNFSLARFHGDIAKASAVYQGVLPLTAADVANDIIFCLKQPNHVNIDEIIVKPTCQGSATKIHRQALSD